MMWKGVLLTAMVTTMCAASAQPFTLTSPVLQEGRRIEMAQVYNGFGYTGENLSPALVWQNAPAETQSFAVTVYDPDAPHPGGWWHWVVLDLPAVTSGLPEGAKPGHGLPPGAVQIENDFGIRDYGGPAPPPGPPHRYIFTVYALKVLQLDVSPRAKPVQVRAALEKAMLAKATVTGRFGR